MQPAATYICLPVFKHECSVYVCSFRCVVIILDIFDREDVWSKLLLEKTISIVIHAPVSHTYIKINLTTIYLLKACIAYVVFKVYHSAYKPTIDMYQHTIVWHRFSAYIKNHNNQHK